jgi:protein-S-isoprenylcysteine O-methyltransferase Ste14
VVFIPAVVMIVRIIISTFPEDRTLAEELQEQDEYCIKIRDRLIPGLR